MRDSFYNKGVKLAFFDSSKKQEKPQPTILLIHGFASLIEINWQLPGWLKTYDDAGFRVIAIENRGHGASDKFYSPEDYSTKLMAEDALALLDYLEIDHTFLQGYSMGARIAAYLTLIAPKRILGLALGGLGVNLIKGDGLPSGIAEALETNHPEEIKNPTQKMFRMFAEKNHQDLKALASCMRGSRLSISEEEAKGILCPTIVAVGTKDDIAGAPEPLAALLPNAYAFSIEGRDHNLAVGDKNHRNEVIRFFKSLIK